MIFYLELYNVDIQIGNMIAILGLPVVGVIDLLQSLQEWGWNWTSRCHGCARLAGATEVCCVTYRYSVISL